jgi:hypothetical protein
MKNKTPPGLSVFVTLFLLAGILLLTGCRSSCCTPSTTTASAAAAPAAATPVVAPPPMVATPAVVAPAAIGFPVRIKAGLTTAIKDADGNTWLPDQGFADGETAERPELAITNTTSPMIYQSERYSMTAFSYPVPNGKYLVKLHFCETYDGITGPGQRVFSFSVQGHEFKDFDVYAKTGGLQRADVETVNVEVTDGKLVITFQSNIENPEINGIEIIPAA